ncbi:MAG: polymorphic toxin type 44 domain-containing protein [Caldilineaceae bacterium]|nr:polymorphic toxin type 44 domain-containing protein [Caldilineaceae bacterium]
MLRRVTRPRLPGQETLCSWHFSYRASHTSYSNGAQRSAWGTLHTDRTFTGQKEDGTGLLYYNARYYDPALGTFISPDTLVPDAGMAIDYNRFLYARGNPLKYSDPTGYIPTDLPEEPPGPPPGADPWVVDFYWKNRWYNARGFARRADGHWDRRIRPRYEDVKILHEVIREDLLGWFIREIKGNTQDERLLTIRGLNEASRLHLTSLSPAGGEFSTSFKITAYAMWALLVGPGRPWDYKGHIGMALDEPWTDYGGVTYFYDVWANINYGYAGRAARFTRGELRLGAGLGQIASDLSRGQLWNYDQSSSFDDPADQAAVLIGMNLYDQYGLGIDEDYFGKAFQEEADNLLIQRP